MTARMNDRGRSPKTGGASSSRGEPNPGSRGRRGIDWPACDMGRRGAGEGRVEPEATGRAESVVVERRSEGRNGPPPEGARRWKGESRGGEGGGVRRGCCKPSVELRSDRAEVGRRGASGEEAVGAEGKVSISNRELQVLHGQAG